MIYWYFYIFLPSKTLQARDKYRKVINIMNKSTTISISFFKKEIYIASEPSYIKQKFLNSRL